MSGNFRRWLHPPDEVTLERDEVHIWRTDLDGSRETDESLRGKLSSDEIERLYRFRFPVHARRFLVGRATLRRVIARYISVEPGALRFEYGPFGKPSLSPRACEFNLAHAKETMLVALTQACPVGIDVEKIEPSRDDREIAHRFFSTREIRDLAALPSEMRQEAFYACWVRKEAYLKLRGEALSVPLDSFDVSVSPRSPAKLIATRQPIEDASRVMLQDLPLGSEFRAALACENVLEARFWAMSPDCP